MQGFATRCLGGKVSSVPVSLHPTQRPRDNGGPRGVFTGSPSKPDGKLGAKRAAQGSQPPKVSKLVDEKEKPPPCPLSSTPLSDYTTTVDRVFGELGRPPGRMESREQTRELEKQPKEASLARFRNPMARRRTLPPPPHSKAAGNTGANTQEALGHRGQHTTTGIQAVTKKLLGIRLVLL